MTTIVIAAVGIAVAVWVGFRVRRGRREAADTNDYGHVSQSWLVEQRSGGRQDRFS